MGRKKTYGDQEPEGPQGAPGEGHGHATEGGEDRSVSPTAGPRTAPPAGGKHGSQTGARVPPVYTVQCGRIRGVVWRNQGPDGEWFSCTVTRSFKDNSNPPVYKQATSFGRDDLLVVSEVMRVLWTWIVQRQAAGTEPNKSAPTSDEPIPF